MLPRGSTPQQMIAACCAHTRVCRTCCTWVGCGICSRPASCRLVGHADPRAATKATALPRLPPKLPSCQDANGQVYAKTRLDLTKPQKLVSVPIATTYSCGNLPLWPCAANGGRQHGAISRSQSKRGAQARQRICICIVLGIRLRCASAICASEVGTAGCRALVIIAAHSAYS